MVDQIDLNCDCGESFGAWTMGADPAVLPLVSSANIACGFHAGDPLIMQRTIDLCLQHGVAIGAHPGLRDLVGFGRRELRIAPAELHAETLYQIGALAALCKARGASLGHVKPHGALYHLLARELPLAQAFVDAVRLFDPQLRVVGPPRSVLLDQALAGGLKVAAEGFVERGYNPDGQLIARGQPGAELEHADHAMAQALDLAQRGGVRTVDGRWCELSVQTLCLHGDRPDAAAFARVLRDGLATAGVKIRALDSSGTNCLRSTLARN